MLTLIQFLSTLSLRRATLWDAPEMPTQEISIHALLAESDLRVMDDSKSSIISIHALLAESDQKKKINPANQNFYPRSPCGERLMQAMAHLMELLFLSTLSLRRATYIIGRAVDLHPFLSTLSLRRATSGGTDRTRIYTYFYPRSPCGERPA